MSVKLDEKDLAILQLIQENSKLTANQIAKKINSPITTVFAKIKTHGRTRHNKTVPSHSIP